MELNPEVFREAAKLIGTGLDVGSYWYSCNAITTACWEIEVLPSVYVIAYEARYKKAGFWNARWPLNEDCSVDTDGPRMAELIAERKAALLAMAESIEQA